MSRLGWGFLVPGHGPFVPRNAGHRVDEDGGPGQYRRSREKKSFPAFPFGNFSWLVSWPPPKDAKQTETASIVVIYIRKGKKSHYKP